MDRVKLKETHHRVANKIICTEYCEYTVFRNVKKKHSVSWNITVSDDKGFRLEVQNWVMVTGTGTASRPVVG
jgi:hypothetical protein